MFDLSPPVLPILRINCDEVIIESWTWQLPRYLKLGLKLIEDGNSTKTAYQSQGLNFKALDLVAGDYACPKTRNYGDSECQILAPAFSYQERLSRVDGLEPELHRATINLAGPIQKTRS